MGIRDQYVPECIKNQGFKKEGMKREAVIPVEDLPRARCIHMVISMNLFNRFMEKGIISLSNSPRKQS